jgi:PPM family protein phosphatase
MTQFSIRWILSLNRLSQKTGQVQVLVETHEQELCDGDIVLLCSDGLTHTVPERAIAEVLSRNAGLRQRADELVARAKLAGGPDNITIVLLRYQE